MTDSFELSEAELAALAGFDGPREPRMDDFMARKLNDSGLLRTLILAQEKRQNGPKPEGLRLMSRDAILAERLLKDAPRMRVLLRAQLARIKELRDEHARLTAASEAREAAKEAERGKVVSVAYIASAVAAARAA